MDLVSSPDHNGSSMAAQSEGVVMPFILSANLYDPLEGSGTRLYVDWIECAFNSSYKNRACSADATKPV